MKSIHRILTTSTFALALLFALPAAAQGNGGRPDGAGPPGDGCNNSPAGNVVVHWHCEGQGPTVTRVCVYPLGAPVPGSPGICQDTSCYGPGSGDTSIELDAQYADSATYSVWVGPDFSDMVLGEVTITSVAANDGEACDLLPLEGNSGINFCQDPRANNVKRNNTYYNKNTTNGQGQGGEPEDCNDGVDNDCDGLVDGDDPQCQRPRRDEICDDGRDNDGDGLVDGEDPDCQADCPDPTLDSDADGIPDCDDPCPFDANPDCQVDCPDIDGDGIPDCDVPEEF